MEIKILYEDDLFFVVLKPAGITVNRSQTTAEQMTVQDWAEKKMGIQSPLRLKQGSYVNEKSAHDVFLSRGGIVHRLDKETSGILLIAKTVPAFEDLQRQFKERIVKKVYLALAHGKISPDAGEINVPVGRLPWNRERFGVLSGGRESITSYKVLVIYKNPKTKELLSFVELYPKSGRTHQIRVHLKHINHPIFADYLYAGRKTARSDRKILPRVFLHAAGIKFRHPESDKEVSFENPLPLELSRTLDGFVKLE